MLSAVVSGAGLRGPALAAARDRRRAGQPRAGQRLPDNAAELAALFGCGAGERGRAAGCSLLGGIDHRQVWWMRPIAEVAPSMLRGDPAASAAFELLRCRRRGSQPACSVSKGGHDGGPRSPASTLGGSRDRRSGAMQGDPTGCGDVWGATFFLRLLDRQHGAPKKHCKPPLPPPHATVELLAALSGSARAPARGMTNVESRRAHPCTPAPLRIAARGYPAGGARVLP